MDKETGYVYILKNEAMPGMYKIGITGRDDLDDRINELYNGKTNIPLPFDCIFACKVENYKEVEKIIHNAFQDSRVNPNREFFTINPDRVIPLLKHLQIEDATININDKINETITEADKDASINYTKKRPKFNFIEMGISIGEKIIFSKDDNPVEAAIASAKLVKYNGIEYTLTKLTSDHKVRNSTGFVSCKELKKVVSGSITYRSLFPASCRKKNPGALVARFTVDADGLRALSRCPPDSPLCHPAWFQAASFSARPH